MCALREERNENKRTKQGRIQNARYRPYHLLRFCHIEPLGICRDPMGIDRGPICQVLPLDSRPVDFAIDSLTWILPEDASDLPHALFLSYPFIHVCPLTWNMLPVFNWQKTYRKVSKNAPTKHIPIWQRRRLMWISGGRVSGDAWGLWPWRQKWHWDKTCIKVLSRH